MLAEILTKTVANVSSQTVGPLLPHLLHQFDILYQLQFVLQFGSTLTNCTRRLPGGGGGGGGGGCYLLSYIQGTMGVPPGVRHYSINLGNISHY